MPTAHLHDGAPLDVTVFGDGPAVLMPFDPAVIEGAAADNIRAWGNEPNLGHTLATALAGAGLRVITAGYETHLAQHPKPHTLTADAVAADLLAVADAAGAERFAYYGYSWLALAGLQLAIRTDRPKPTADPEPGDWDAVEFTLNPDQTQQYVTLYESLRNFDEPSALDKLTMPRMVFAGANDNITYGAAWDDARVAIADPLRTHAAELIARGWTVHLIPDTDHMSALQASAALPLLTPWLQTHATP